MKKKPQKSAVKYHVALTTPAAEYLAELMKKYRVTAEQIIQAAAEATMAYAYDQAHTTRPDASFEGDIIDDAMELAEDGTLIRFDDNWNVAAREKACAKEYAKEQKEKSEREASMTLPPGTVRFPPSRN